jgi:hypothetical protein
MGRAILLLFILSACASGLRRTDFHATRATPKAPHRTVVLFLVDGLAVRTLQTGLEARVLPNLRHYFLPKSDRFVVGQAAFPTLTYPNVASILTAKPIGEQPILGNQMLEPNGEIVAYDSARNIDKIRQKVDPKTVIAELNKEGRETATFSYILGHNAADHMRLSLRDGLEYDREDYRKLDARLLQNLSEFLRERGEPSRWPDFIYVHLVGVDALSHAYGPDSPVVNEYLAWLDSQLGETLSLLAAAEARPKSNIVTFLTADHGFVAVPNHSDAAKLVRREEPRATLINEGRFIALFAPSGSLPQGLSPLLSKLRSRRGVEFTVLRRGATLELGSGSRMLRFAIGSPVCEESPVSLAPIPAGSAVLPAAAFRCPTDLDDSHGDYPFLLAGLARYFSAPRHPDALVLAGPSFAFTKGFRGHHGGATAREAYVPVLLRNVTLQGSAPVRTSDLLKIFEPARL